MVRFIPRRGLFIPVLCVIASVLLPVEAEAQPNPLPLVPSYLSPRLRDSLVTVRAALDARLLAYRAKKAAYDSRCGGLIPAEATARIAACNAEYATVIPEATLLGKEKSGFVAFVAHLDSLNAANPRWAQVDPVAPNEPPSPVIDEESQYFANPIAWYDKQALSVRHAVYLNKKWTSEVLKAIKDLTAPPPLTDLSALSAGDVLLVRPVSANHDVIEHVKGKAIALGDYELRAISAFANGGLLNAASVQYSDISHSLTFIREVNGHMLFLDHDTKGTRVIDETQFYRDYGVRDMLVARPQDVVDGRELWKAAHDLALNQRGYGVTGDKVVCSQMCAIAVARATKTEYTAGNLGPIDITPGDFYDKSGNAGKHFVVTRLNIAPADKK